MRVEIPSRFAGPPSMAHGGYLAGLFVAAAEDAPGAVQVTLRRPTPLDEPLDLDRASDGRLGLRHGDTLLAEAHHASLALDVPPSPTVEVTQEAEARSPSHYREDGVHPTCFGCGRRRAPGDGLRIFAGPVVVDGRAQVAGLWRPGDAFARPDGTADARFVAAALDCPGAFAFIAEGFSAGLLGRLVVERYGEVDADAEHVVTGWRIGSEGRKLFAGTALFGPDGTLLAAARATWFSMIPG